MAFSYTAPRIELDEIAKELNDLDSDATEQRRRDLYGEYADISEPPEFLTNSLIELQKSLEAIEPGAKKHSFLRAKKECPDYVNSDDLLLEFLRAERFNASLAADRVVAYWEQKVLLFPNDKEAFGPISLDMLNESDLRVLRNGGLSLLPNDTHGRAVIHADRGGIELQVNGSNAVVSAHISAVPRQSRERCILSLVLSLGPSPSSVARAALPYACRLRRCLGPAEGHGFDIGIAISFHSGAIRPIGR